MTRTYQPGRYAYRLKISDRDRRFGTLRLTGTLDLRQPTAAARVITQITDAMTPQQSAHQVFKARALTYDMQMENR